MRSMSKNFTKAELKKILNDPKFIKTVTDELLSSSTHELIQKPRLHFDESKKGKRLEVKVVKDIDDDEFEFDEDDYDDDEGYYDPGYEYYRRDSFLTGGAVAAVIAEKLLSIPRVINDIDIFFYKFKSKEKASAESERYNNLSGDEVSYKIVKAKEVGILNFVEINIEDEFSWLKVLESFDLNYSQVGIVLADQKMVFTDEFLKFLQNPVVQVSADYENDFPLTTYIRAAHKALDFKTKFYDKEAIRPYLAHDLGESIFKEDLREFEVTHKNEEADNDTIVLVTEKRFDYWLKNPTILPYLVPVMEGKVKKFKVNLPQESWVDIVKSIYNNKQSQNNYYYSNYDVLSDLSTAVPNFYDMKKSTALRLKNFIGANLIKFSRGSNSPLKMVLTYNPKILKQDFSTNQLIKVEEFFKSHQEFLQSIAYIMLLNKKTVNEVLDVFAELKNWDLTYFGILESSGIYVHNVNKNGEPEISLRSGTMADAKRYTSMILNNQVKDLEKEIEQIYLKQLEKNRLVPKEKMLKINPFSKWVKEIVQLDHLHLEGQNMNHCVGGYANKIKDNQCRIFHICVNGKHSTLEIGMAQKPFISSHKKHGWSDESKKIFNSFKAKPTKTKFSNLQHRGKYNSNPDKTNEKVAQLLIRYLNHLVD